MDPMVLTMASWVLLVAPAEPAESKPRLPPAFSAPEALRERFAANRQGRERRWAAEPPTDSVAPGLGETRPVAAELDVVGLVLAYDDGQLTLGIDLDAEARASLLRRGVTAALDRPRDDTLFEGRYVRVLRVAGELSEASSSVARLVGQKAVLTLGRSERAGHVVLRARLWRGP